MPGHHRSAAGVRNPVTVAIAAVMAFMALGAKTVPSGTGNETMNGAMNAEGAAGSVTIGAEPWRVCRSDGLESARLQS